MTNKIALTAIFAVLATNAAFATGIGYDGTPDTCDSSVLGATEGSVNLQAQWTANEYTFTLTPGTGATGTATDVTCTYDDTNTAATAATTCDLTYKGFAKETSILTSWKATDGTDDAYLNVGTGKLESLLKSPTTIGDVTALGTRDTTTPNSNEYAVTLEAQWTPCTYTGGDSVNGNNVTSVVQSVENNKCKYVVTCTPGYKYTADGNIPGTVTKEVSGTSSPLVANDIVQSYTIVSGEGVSTVAIPACATGNSITLHWTDVTTDDYTETSGEGQNNTCTYGGQINNIPQPTRDGYTFGGWEID